MEFCRVCAQRSDQTQDLFEIVHNGVFLSEMLMYCLKRPNIQEECLPTAICLTCQSNLVTTYDFLKLCETSEKFLLERLASKYKAINQIDGVELKSEIEHTHDVDSDIDIVSESESKFTPELVCVQDHFGRNVTSEESLQPAPMIKDELDSQNTATNEKLEHQTVEYFECFECKEKFDQLSELCLHMKFHEGNRKPYECSKCKNRFVNQKSWLRHCARHTKEIHKCEYCEQAFSTLLPLRKHIKDLHKDRLNAYACGKCSKKFALQFLLTWHLEWHKKAKEFVCSTCNEKFFQERQLNTHNRKKHAKYLCSECGKIFKTTQLLTSHRLSHTAETKFACNFCSGQFSRRSSLYNHMRLHNQKERHKCDMCGSSFSTKGAMTHHKKIHTEDRQHQCEMCSMRFYTKNHLKRHLLSHSGERPHICSHCPRSFSQSNDLVKHLRSHVGPNIYKCHCGASFRLQSELRKHSYTHYNKDESKTSSAAADSK